MKNVYMVLSLNRNWRTNNVEKQEKKNQGTSNEEYRGDIVNSSNNNNKSSK